MISSELEGSDALGDEPLDLGEEDELAQPVDEQERAVGRRELNLVGGRLASRIRGDQVGEGDKCGVEDSGLAGRLELDPILRPSPPVLSSRM